MNRVLITDIKVMVIDGKGIGGPWNLIRVETNEGVWGLGESYWGVGVRTVIDGLLKPLLIGEDARNVDRLYTAMTFRLGGAHTLSGLVMAAISGIEIALWDLFGKLSGLPVYRLLGGAFRDSIRAYCTGTPMGLEDAGKCREYAAKVREHGYTAIKAIDADTLWERYDPRLQQPGHERFSRSLTGEDLRLAERILSNLRDAFGESFDIAVHCHWALDLGDAVRLSERIAPYHPRWLEDPLPIPFSPAWVELARATRVPIATGENLYSRHEFRPFIEEHAVSMVNIDVPKSGGLLEAKRIADLADLHYLSTSFHNPASPVGTIASVQAAAAIRGFGLIECFLRDGQWWEDLIVHDGPIVRNGFIAVPEGPGLGIELNPDVVQAHLAPGEAYWGL